MNIYVREMRAHLKSFLAWSGTMVFLILVGLMKYSAFQKTGEAINAMFQQLPPALMKVLGVSPGLDMTSVGVFYSIFYLYFLLLMTVHAAMLGVNAIAGEERDKTVDFLMVKPIRRTQAITAKIIASLSYVILLNLETFIASALFIKPYTVGQDSLTLPILRLTSSLLLIQLLFVALGLLTGAASRKAERASGIMTAIILGTFVLKVFIDVNDKLKDLAWLTPFCYFKSYDVMFSQDIPGKYVILCLLTTGVSLALTYQAYQRRDLHG